MLQIECPNCGLRDETEFVFGGECLPARPAEAEDLDDAAWATFLFDRDNVKGQQLERWQHRFGCRQWFDVRRHTVTHEFAADGPEGAVTRIAKERIA